MQLFPKYAFICTKKCFLLFPTKQIVHVFTSFELKTLKKKKKNMQIHTNPESSPDKLFTFLK